MSIEPADSFHAIPESIGETAGFGVVISGGVLKEKKSETPILLLDDAFDELDVERAMKLISFVGNVGQVFITATDLNVLSGISCTFNQNALPLSVKKMM